MPVPPTNARSPNNRCPSPLYGSPPKNLWSFIFWRGHLVENLGFSFVEAVTVLRGFACRGRRLAYAVGCFSPRTLAPAHARCGAFFARPAPENLGFCAASWNGAGWRTPIISPEAIRPTQRLAAQIIGESGLRNPKSARLGAEKRALPRLSWGLEGIRFREIQQQGSRRT